MKYLIAILLLISCAKEDIRIEVYPPEVLPYVQMFKDEAKSRGLVYDFNGLHVYLQDVIPPVSVTYVGFSGDALEAYYNPTEHAIYIKTSGFNWNEMPAELVCHELGHAILKRRHNFDRLSDGSAVSIMGCPCSNTKTGWSEPGREGMKEYYFDELFNIQCRD